MTDRHAGYIVTLDKNVREDDAEPILNALRMVRGVVSVTPVVADHETAIGESRSDMAWRQKLANLITDR